TLDQAEKSVSTQRLHQALHGAEAQFEIEIAVHRKPVIELAPAIVCGQLCAFAFRKMDIGIIQQRPEVVFGKTGAHSLKIDQVRLAVSDDDVLRFKIAVQQKCTE